MIVCRCRVNAVHAIVGDARGVENLGNACCERIVHLDDELHRAVRIAACERTDRISVCAAARVCPSRAGVRCVRGQRFGDDYIRRADVAGVGVGERVRDAFARADGEYIIRFRQHQIGRDIIQIICISSLIVCRRRVGAVRAIVGDMRGVDDLGNACRERVVHLHDELHRAICIAACERTDRISVCAVAGICPSRSKRGRMRGQRFGDDHAHCADVAGVSVRERVRDAFACADGEHIIRFRQNQIGRGAADGISIGGLIVCRRRVNAVRAVVQYAGVIAQ